MVKECGLDKYRHSFFGRFGGVFFFYLDIAVIGCNHRGLPDSSNPKPTEPTSEGAFSNVKYYDLKVAHD